MKKLILITFIGVTIFLSNGKVKYFKGDCNIVDYVEGMVGVICSPPGKFVYGISPSLVDEIRSDEFTPLNNTIFTTQEKEKENDK